MQFQTQILLLSFSCKGVMEEHHSQKEEGLPSVCRNLQTSCRVAVSFPVPQMLSACPHAPCAGPEWAGPTSGG